MKKLTIPGLPFWISLIMLIIVSWLLIVRPSHLVILQNISYDALQRIFPREYQPAPVRIIDIDEESLRRYGQWPWPRTRIAAMVEALTNMGATALVFDMVFAEPDRTSPAELIRQWPENKKLAAMVKSMPDNDLVLAQAIENSVVVTGFTLVEGTVLELPAAKPAFITAGGSPNPYVPHMAGAVGNLEVIESAAMGNGSFNYTADYDGVVRHVPLLVRVNDILYPTLAAEALRVAQGAGNISIKTSPQTGPNGGIEAVQIGEAYIETDIHGEVWLHFTKTLLERYIPAWKLLEGQADPELLTGHIVFFGASAKGLSDIRINTLGEMIPGVEAHAQLVEQIFHDTYVRSSSLTKAAFLLLLIGTWALLVALLGRLSLIWTILYACVVIAAVFGTSAYYFTEKHFYFDPLFPAFAIAAIFITFFTAKHYISEKERAWIRNAFSSYVSPNLVRHLVENPKQLNLGGERRECSFVFTDLAGFTSLMEKSDPASIVTLLNNYLEGMVQVAFKYEGTLDRFVGDAVAVIFSAPITQPDHACRAVDCAREMDIFARKFSADRQAEGIPFGKTRIGVHSGIVMVGNFGGKTMLDYRALGDPINTAARLESVNKHLGTNVCISGDTAAMCDNFIGRPIGKLVLKGKTKELEVFEPLSAEEAASPRITEYLQAYQMLNDIEPGAMKAFSELVEKYPDDPLAALHYGSLEQGLYGTTLVMTAK